MTITKEQLEEIKSLRLPKDVSLLHKLTGIPKSTLYVILDKGLCSTGDAAKILKFYKKRKQEREALKTILPDND